MYHRAGADRRHAKKPERFLRSGSGMLSQISFVVNQVLNTFPASSMVT